MYADESEGGWEKGDLRAAVQISVIGRVMGHPTRSSALQRVAIHGFTSSSHCSTPYHHPWLIRAMSLQDQVAVANPAAKATRAGELMPLAAFDPWLIAIQTRLESRHDRRRTDWQDVFDGEIRRRQL